MMPEDPETCDAVECLAYRAFSSSSDSSFMMKSSSGETASAVGGVGSLALPVELALLTELMRVFGLLDFRFVGGVDNLLCLLWLFER